MPINEIHADALVRERRIMEQVFDLGDKDAGAENARRPRSPRATIKATPKVGGGSNNTPAATPVVQKPVTPPIAAIIDRVHKESGSVYGGYIFVGPDHDASESDQIPPSNPGWRTPGVSASSISDAYAKALIMKALPLKPGARIAIIILGGTWTEPALTIAVQGIDIFGIGTPQITGQITVGQTSDACLYNFDVYSSSPTDAGLTLQDYVFDPVFMPLLRTAPMTTIKGVRCYGAQIAFRSHRVFHAEHFECYQTTKLDITLEIAACVIEVVAPVFDVHRMKNCKFVAYSETENIGGVPFRTPFGYALKVTATGGSMLVDTDLYLIPGSALVLDDCEVEGSLICNQWYVEHKGGRQHGGIPFVSGSGKIYARLRGQPLFNEANGYFGSIPSWVTFDSCKVHAAVVAQGVPWNGVYPIGINPATYPGVAYCAFRQSGHLRNFNSAAPTSFVNNGSIFNADVVNASSGCTGWRGGAVGGTDYGTCPVGVVANRDMYLL